MKYHSQICEIFSYLASNVSCVTVEDWAVSVADLARVVENNHLGGEVRHSGGGLVLGVRGDVSSLDVLNGNVFDVEANVVSGHGLTGMSVNLLQKSWVWFIGKCFN